MSTNMTAVVLKKRERTQNWVPEEKNALFSLIKAHVNAIENKRIDAAASAMKTLAWQQIYCAFRGKFSTNRDITRMREQWRRMKAQARLEIYTFAEKIKSLGPEDAAKCRPSSLSMEIWRLIERTKTIDGDSDRSDENRPESTESSASLQRIVDKGTTSTPEVIAIDEIKNEADSDEYNTEEDVNRGENLAQKSQLLQKKRPRFSHDNGPIDLAASRIHGGDTVVHNEDSVFTNSTERKNGFPGEQEETIRKAMWMFEVAQREHELKLRMLNIELERANLQKQTAINELKTSEIKKQLIANQAAEYYSHMRMTGERGSGAGKGGGGGGSIREAGGAFGKMEAAHEDQYFYNLQKEQLQKLKEDLHDEISFHEEQIKRHQEAINRHKQRITNMDKE